MNDRLAKALKKLETQEINRNATASDTSDIMVFSQEIEDALYALQLNTSGSDCDVVANLLAFALDNHYVTAKQYRYICHLCREHGVEIPEH